MAMKRLNKLNQFNFKSNGLLWFKFIMSFILICPLLASAQGQQESASGPSDAVGRLCYITKASKLAIDQRDDERMTCLKKKVTTLNAEICLKIAKSMEYSTSAEEARLTCLYGLENHLNFKECLKISKAMEYPDSGDEVRWECIRHFNNSITLKECHSLAKNMSYPANRQRAQYYCEEELP
jgi:hypothetical protein